VLDQQWRTVKCCGRSDITCSTCPKHCQRFCWLLIAGTWPVLKTYMQCCTCGAPWNLSVPCNFFYHGMHKCFKYTSPSFVVTSTSFPSLFVLLLLLLLLFSYCHCHSHSKLLLLSFTSFVSLSFYSPFSSCVHTAWVTC